MTEVGSCWEQRYWRAVGLGGRESLADALCDVGSWSPQRTHPKTRIFSNVGPSPAQLDKTSLVQNYGHSPASFLNTHFLAITNQRMITECCENNQGFATAQNQVRPNPWIF